MTSEAAPPLSEDPVVAAPAQPLEPIRASERIATIDILRGLALFGIIAANIRAFSGPAIIYFEPEPMWPGLGDRLAQAFVDTFIQGKFIAIFSLLFGVGFAVQLSRAEEREGRFGAIYTRRLLVLLGIGLIHGLFVWWGDILVPYALGGFFLLIFRKKSDGTVLIWAILLYLVPSLLISVVAVLPLITGVPVPSEPPPSADELQGMVALFSEGSWFDIHLQRVHDVATLNWGFTPLFLPQLLGLFLFGALAWRRRIFEPSPVWVSRLRYGVMLGLSFGIAGNAIATAARWISREPTFPPTLASLPAILLQGVANPALTIGYVSLVILLCRNEVWRRRLSGAGAIGRTALSNYLFQSVAGTLLFYSYGLGLYGMGPALLLIPTVLIYAVEWPLSQWWVARWRFGPVEWVWRSLTYGHLQPMRRRGVDPTVE